MRIAFVLPLLAVTLARGAEPPAAEGDVWHVRALVVQAELLDQAGRYAEAGERIAAASELAAARGLPPFETDLGLWSHARLCPAPLNTLVGHDGGVISVDVSRDGRCILSSGHDQAVRLWDGITGRELRRIAEDVNVAVVRFSPGGQSCVTGGVGLTLWDLASGREIRSFDNGPEYVRSVALSPDGRLLAAGGTQLVVYDVGTGRKMWSAAGPNAGAVGVGFSPDGRTVVASLHFGEASLFDAATGRRTAVKSLDSAWLSCNAFRPDGRTVLSADDAGNVALWDIASQKTLWTLDSAGSSGVSGIVGGAFTPDGRTALVQGYRESLRTVDVETGRPRRVIHTDPVDVACSAFSGDGRVAVTGSDDGHVRLWDLGDGRERVPLVGHPRYATHVAFAPDGRTLISSGYDEAGGFRIDDRATGRPLRRVARAAGPVSAVACSPDGRTALFSACDGTARLWDLQADRQLCQLEEPMTDADRSINGWARPGKYVNDVAFTPDGRRAVTVKETTAKLWDLPSGRCVRTFSAASDKLDVVVVSPDGRTVATSGLGKGVTLWDLAAGRPVRELLGHTEWVPTLAFSPDGRSLLSGSMDKSMKLWDVATGRLLRTFTGHNEGLSACAFSPDGRTIASAGMDYTVRLWDVATGQELRTLTGHTAFLRSVAFSPDGLQVVSGGDDPTPILWDFSRPARDRAFAQTVPRAFATLQIHAGDAGASAELGRWYAHRGRFDWASELLQQAADGGAPVTPLELAYAYDQAGQRSAAGRAYQRALAAHAASDDYLRQCPSTTATTRP